MLLVSSACIQARSGSPLDRFMEEAEKTSFDVREDMPVVLGRIREIGARLESVRYRREPVLSIEARQISHELELGYEDGTKVTILTLSPLERQKYSLPVGSSDTLQGTNVNFGTGWASWFNGSEVYEVKSTDPLSVANKIISSTERIDIDRYQGLWFYKGLPLPPENVDMVELSVIARGEQRWASGTYVTDNEESEIEVRIAKDDNFQLPYNIETVIIDGEEFSAGYREDDYVIVKNGVPVSMIAVTPGMYARLNRDLMEKLLSGIAERIVSNQTSA